MLIDRTNEPARLPGSPYWLLVRYEGCHASALTIELAGGEKALPVFSHREEAHRFLVESSEVFEDEGWQARETGNGEFVSMLYGPCQGVKRVVPDPASGSGDEEAADLVGVSRQCFVERLIGRGRSWFDERFARERQVSGIDPLQ